MEEEEINVEGVSAQRSGHEMADGAGDSTAPGTPMADARHFLTGSKLSGEMRLENNPGIVPEGDDGFDVGLADDTLVNGNAPYNLDGNTIYPTFPHIIGFDGEAMPVMSALIAAGTSAEAASNFVDRIMGNENAATFMDMYGDSYIFMYGCSWTLIDIHGHL